MILIILFSYFEYILSTILNIQEIEYIFKEEEKRSDVWKYFYTVYKKGYILKQLGTIISEICRF